MLADRAAMERNGKQILDAYNKKDWERLLSHFNKDGVMLLPLPDGLREVKGVQALRAMYGQSSGWSNPEVVSSEISVAGVVWCVDEMALIWKQVDVLKAGGKREKYGLSLVKGDDNNKVTYWKDYF